MYVESSDIYMYLPEITEINFVINGLQGVKLRHPAGCPKIISINGNGLGWFGTLWLMYVS